ncbi:MAG: T9SS type A sorting domain-containing protein [Bacteroidales bacterium]|nr:T9SS type A sorting domain-containing protein [Bacteroidales bacterium]
MKKLTYILFVLHFSYLSLSINAQQVIATAGGYYESDNISLNWTLGESVTETFSGGGVILTQGFQQPYNFYIAQLLNIPAGWSGISSYVEPVNKSVEGMFAPYANEFIILSTMNGFYYPAGGVNTIGTWSNATGYQIKTGAAIEMEMVGKKLSNHTIQIEGGWNLIPVLSSCDVATDQLFAGLSGFQIIKEVAGVGLYWPQHGINTLPALQPGKAYWVASGNAGSVEFPACAGNAKAGTPSIKPENRSPWNDLSYTAVSHAIAIPAGALVNSGISQGDIIGVFTTDGICAGRADVMEINSGIALTAFANDETTAAKDGFDAGEPLQFKLWSIAEEKEIQLLPTFDQSLPNADGAFAAHGLSAITGFKASTGVTSQELAQSVQIYPNPSAGVVNITGISDGAEIAVSDARGRVVINTHHSSSGVACIDLSSVPAGVYLVKIQQNGNTIFRKLILQ